MHPTTKLPQTSRPLELDPLVLCPNWLEFCYYTVNFHTKLTFNIEKTSKWKPISLKWPFLVAVIILSLILLGLIQSLLIQSAHNSGLLFADNINALPIRETFTYLYLPTIISVVYGFFWTWIDLDVRRLEPYYQASYTNGATGNQSLLLHYPVDFVASVPIKALKFG